MSWRIVMTIAVVVDVVVDASDDGPYGRYGKNWDPGGETLVKR